MSLLMFEHTTCASRAVIESNKDAVAMRPGHRESSSARLGEEGGNFSKHFRAHGGQNRSQYKTEMVDVGFMVVILVSVGLQKAR